VKTTFLEFGVLKRIVLTMMILGLVAGVWGTCYATSFTDIVDFSGSGTDGTRTYLELSGSGSPEFTYEYSHDIYFDPPAQSLNSATLTLSHRGNNANEGEAWLISDTGSVFLGDLANSTHEDTWVDQVFYLSNLLGSISGDTWTLELILHENTTGTDKLWIDKSVLTGDYTASSSSAPVPEPASMLLFGSGLLAYAGLRKRFKK
jgi:hypothetical protein